MESSQKKGLFLPSANLDSGLIIDCLRALHSDFPSIKFTSISSDEKLGGFKVCFSDLEETVVLKRKQLMISDKEIFIYPLTTYLWVSGIHSKRTPLYERDVRDAILRKFGKVLSVKIDSSNEWLVEIQIPEYKWLQVFERHIQSELKVRLSNRNEDLKIEFYCKDCNKPGHFRHECATLEPVTSKESSGSNSRSNESFSSESNQPSNGRTNFPLESTSAYAEKIGREAIIKEWSDGNVKQFRAASGNNNNLLNKKDIKKETEELGAGKDEKYSETGKSTSSKANHNNRRESHENWRDAVSSDTNDDDIQIITDPEDPNKKSPTSLASPDSNFPFKIEGDNLTESSRSELDLSSRSAFESSSSATPGPSFLPQRPVKGAEVTTILSERLQETINEACNSVGVLGRQKLDAFLIHVKKKSNPIRVALNYTQNTKGLKEQLKKILFIYYNTPQTGTKEDIQFVKWLNGLIERFDGSIPKKRKRAGKSNDDDDSPAKKMK